MDHLNRATSGQVLVEMVNIKCFARGVDHEKKPVVQVGYHEVVENAARLVGEKPVSLTTDAKSRHVDGHQGFECGRRVSSVNCDLSHVGDVEKPGLSPRVQVLLDDTSRILQGHLIARERDHLGAKRLVEIEKWGSLGALRRFVHAFTGGQVSGLAVLLRRTDNNRRTEGFPSTTQDVRSPGWAPFLKRLCMVRRTANPVVVETVRGEQVENLHRGAFAVVRSDGQVIAQAGDTRRPVYGRSAVKPLQAIPLIESGALDHFGLGPREVALACASHGGEAQHVSAVAHWLSAIRLGPGDLECGAHLPTHKETRLEMIRHGIEPLTLHQTCSGKHAGFLTTAVYYREPTSGYVLPDHPVQRRVRAALEELTESKLAGAPCGVDGCGIPVIGIPLKAMALGFARFSNPEQWDESRSDALRRVFEAMVTEPYLVAGSDRTCTEIMTLGEGRFAVKTGAEGVYSAIVPAEGIGIALKIDDGSTVAAEVLVAALLARYGGAGRKVGKLLQDRAVKTNFNVAGTQVGETRALDV